MTKALERKAKNQALFRAVNEQIVNVTDDQGTTEFVCECSNTDCIEVIEIPDIEYTRIRGNPTWFVIKQDHDIPQIEHVVSEDDGYAVVEKLVAQEYMEETDPRSDGAEA